MAAKPGVDLDTQPELEVRFWDRWGSYMKVQPLREQAQRARELLGRRRITRIGEATYRVSDDSGRGYYHVALAHMQCSCPAFSTRSARVCKHLIACQWIEDCLV